jgi:hypothetical protein
VINIRYHIFTLVAVFLALAIGLVAGSTVIQQSLVDQLEGNLDRLEQANDDVEQRNGELDEQLGALRKIDEALADQGPAQLLRDRLAGTTVLMLGVDGIDESSLGSLRDTIATSGAVLAGPIWLRERLALADQDDADALGTILGIGTRSPSVLHAELAQRLGDLLAVVGTAAPPAPVDGDDDGNEDSSTATERPVVSGVTAAASATRLVELLDALEEARFIDVDGGLDDLRPADLVGARFVVGGGSGAKVDDNALVIPILERLSQNAAPSTVVVEAQPADAETPGGEFVGAVRSDRRLRDRLSTVDDAGVFAGWAATVLALDDLGRGRVGHYGSGAGAERLLPAPSNG